MLFYISYDTTQSQLCALFSFLEKKIPYVFDSQHELSMPPLYSSASVICISPRYHVKHISTSCCLSTSVLLSTAPWLASAHSALFIKRIFMAVSIFSLAQVNEISCVTEQHGSETRSLKQTCVYLHFCKLEGRWRKQNFANRIRWGKVKSRYQGNGRLLIIYWNRKQVYTIHCRELDACGKHQKLLKNAFIMFFRFVFACCSFKKCHFKHFKVFHSKAVFRHAHWFGELTLWSRPCQSQCRPSPNS